MPDWFLDLVKRIAAIENLPENWINASTSLIGNSLQILPPAYFAELEETFFGERLRVSFLNRDAQILLKTYAILGREELRDELDLKALGPNAEEMRRALEWIRKNELVRADVLEEKRNRYERHVNETE